MINKRAVCTGGIDCKIYTHARAARAHRNMREMHAVSVCAAQCGMRYTHGYHSSVAVGPTYGCALVRSFSCAGMQRCEGRLPIQRVELEQGNVVVGQAILF